ncbi:carbon-nitrogen hydrolase family protein [Aliikangiella sp. G2MR2-5]|uniref:carbon-nitrogen hydrolase family protein n=1 Tax=Aliikangiella sp. G2MR2-5 TaxID=2788943 RepID=UPI0018ABF677|nr:carbon-nitrogen hydrolase family protein [Aliikangiella sp. G2MR2-5]
MSQTSLTVALAQIAPVWFKRAETLVKVCQSIEKASNQGAGLVVFGEALVPGYPFWLELTGGAAFNDARQKAIQAEYIKQAVNIERGDLQCVCDCAKAGNIAVYLGVIERASDRGGHSLYCSLIYIDQSGEIQSVHRKLMPTYEERLSWSIGDGHGLVTHSLEPFTLGGLNCWENWMPLARASLYGQGENLHVAVWPGSERNTADITPVIAKEGRSFVLSVSAIMRPQDAKHADIDIPEILQSDKGWLANGGSCIAAPDGSWVLPPQTESEDIFIAELSFDKVLQERQNFDPAGHYSRPDVTQLIVNRSRQSTVKLVDK